MPRNLTRCEINNVFETNVTCCSGTGSGAVMPLRCDHCDGGRNEARCGDECATQRENTITQQKGDHRRKPVKVRTRTRKRPDNAAITRNHRSQLLPIFSTVYCTVGIFRQANYKLKNQDYIKQLVHASSQCDDVPLSCKLQAARSIAAFLDKTWEAVAPGKPQRCQSDSRTAERTMSDATRRGVRGTRQTQEERKARETSSG